MIIHQFSREKKITECSMGLDTLKKICIMLVHIHSILKKKNHHTYNSQKKICRSYIKINGIVIRKFLAHTMNNSADFVIIIRPK